MSVYGDIAWATGMETVLDTVISRVQTALPAKIAEYNEVLKAQHPDVDWSDPVDEIDPVKNPYRIYQVRRFLKGNYWENKRKPTPPVFKNGRMVTRGDSPYVYVSDATTGQEIPLFRSGVYTHEIMLSVFHVDNAYWKERIKTYKGNTSRPEQVGTYEYLEAGDDGYDASSAESQGYAVLRQLRAVSAGIVSILNNGERLTLDSSRNSYPPLFLGVEYPEIVLPDDAKQYIGQADISFSIKV